jgi:DNA-binding XRE family transcriptional regulator
MERRTSPASGVEATSGAEPDRMKGDAVDGDQTGGTASERGSAEPDDVPFVGIRPEVDRVVRAADERIGGRITKEQDRAAQLMARLLDAEAVDEALDLVPGTLDSWMGDEAFVRRVAEDRCRVEVYRTPDEDLGRILSSKQRAAARMRGLEMLSQIEVARALEVTDRTIRNWEKNPAFRLYQDQLEAEEEKRRRARGRVESDLFSEGREKALKSLVRAVEEGDQKAAVELLKLRR